MKSAVARIVFRVVAQHVLLCKVGSDLFDQIDIDPACQQAVEADNWTRQMGHLFRHHDITATSLRKMLEIDAMRQMAHAI